MDKRKTLALIQSRDPNTAFKRLTPSEILARYGPPRSLLSSSFKTEKCLSVGVLARVLYLTPGVFCSHATPGCLAACLGHSSGRMQMPTHALARDRRTALYHHDNHRFLRMLWLDLSLLRDDARAAHLRPAVRLNGSSDISWETRHPELFSDFPDIAFYDYTKNPGRMHQFLHRDNWPENYHLSFSAAPGNHEQARSFLAAGGTVAVVFWPNIPGSFWGFQVLDGDTHDARFLDPKGSIVALIAKGLAQADTTGFTVHVCPCCARKAPSRHLHIAA